MESTVFDIKDEKLLREDLGQRQKALGPDHPDLAENLLRLGDVLWESGRGAYAEALFRRVIRIREISAGPDDPSLIAPLCRLAGLLKGLRISAEARENYQRALAIAERTAGADDPSLIEILTALGPVAEGQEEACYDRALGIREHSKGVNDLSLVEPLESLARRYPQRAEACYRRILALREKNLGPNDLSVADTLTDLAGAVDLVLWPEGTRIARIREAKALYRRAWKIRRAELGAKNPDTLQSRQRFERFWLGNPLSPGWARFGRLIMAWWVVLYCPWYAVAGANIVLAGISGVFWGGSAAQYVLRDGLRFVCLGILAYVVLFFYVWWDIWKMTPGAGRVTMFLLQVGVVYDLAFSVMGFWDSGPRATAGGLAILVAKASAAGINFLYWRHLKLSGVLKAQI
jgi:tetratricopeptide (TPR) repeat protein